MNRPAERLLAAIGETPLLELDLPELPEGARLFAKLEAVNPGGSIKDRPVLRMLTRARDAGLLNDGRRVLDSSSGNAGIAYAQIGALLGVPITLVVPGNASRERLERIAAYGAELILTDPMEGYDHAIYTARKLAAEQPELYWYCDQYGNDDNWRAHYEGTGVEILRQVREIADRAPDVLVAGVGTGGTLTGTGRRLREEHPATRVTAVIPEVFPGIEGLKPLGREEDLVPDILDESLIDERIELTLDEAVARSRDLARRGIYVGPSSGAYVEGALRVARPGEILVTLLNDTGERYGSTGMWERKSESG